MRNNRSVYKNELQEAILMAKKEVSISLDIDILKKIDESCQNNEFEIKRSVFINGILKEYFKKKEGEKKSQFRQTNMRFKT